MKLNRRYKPEVAALHDGSRPVLMNAHLDVKAKAIYASDSFVMVKAPVEVEKGDTSGPISTEALVTARESGGGQIKCANGRLDIPGYATFPRPKTGKTPEWEKLRPTSEPVITVRFNLDILKRAAESLGGGTVDLQFFAEKDAPITEQAIVMVSADPNRDSDAWALLMPVRRSQL